MKILAIAIAIILAGTSALSSYQMRPEPRAADIFEIRNIYDIGAIATDEYTLTIPITNKSSTPRRIIGVEETCQRMCCFRSRHHEQITVAPGETFEYHCQVTFFHRGTFQVVIGVFLEEDGIREEIITIRGIALRPEVDPDAKSANP